MDAVLETLKNHNICLSKVITKLLSLSKYHGHPAHIDLCLHSDQICLLLQNPYNPNGDLPPSLDGESSLFTWAFNTVTGKYKTEIQDLIKNSEEWRFRLIQCCPCICPTD
jgi:hypothetical protein